MSPRRPFPLAVLFALSLALRPVSSIAAQAAPRCEGNVAQCVRTRSFDAAIVDFRVSALEHQRLLTVSLRIRNTLDRPLVLGYVYGSAVAIDDQGSRYTINSEQSVRGLGVVTTSRFDPKFTLQPGETSDARLELAWNSARNQLFGTRFTLELALREIDPVPGNQFRLGREHAFRFAGLADQPPVIADGAGAAPTSSNETASPAPTGAPTTVLPQPIADPCDGRARCAATPVFLAEVTNVAAATDNGYHVLRYRMRVRNLTTQSLVLAYTANSSSSLDEIGQRYTPGFSYRSEPETRGIGVATGSRVDPQFSLAPGQTREISFTLGRSIGNTALGRRYSWDLALQEIQVLNGGQLRSLREHAIGFRDLDIGVASVLAGDDAAAQQVQDGVKKIGEALGGLFRKKKP
jgi:hypothetical protein